MKLRYSLQKNTQGKQEGENAANTTHLSGRETLSVRVTLGALESVKGDAAASEHGDVANGMQEGEKSTCGNGEATVEGAATVDGGATSGDDAMDVDEEFEGDAMDVDEEYEGDAMDVDEVLDDDAMDVDVENGEDSMDVDDK